MRTRRFVVTVLLVLVGLVAVDCCNATAEWAWFDLTRAPHMAAVHTSSPVTDPADVGGAVIPPAVAGVLLVLVLLFVVGTDRRPRWSDVGATGPPLRGPPLFSVLLANALEIRSNEPWNPQPSSSCDGPRRRTAGGGWPRPGAPGSSS